MIPSSVYPWSWPREQDQAIWEAFYFGVCEQLRRVSVCSTWTHFLFLKWEGQLGVRLDTHHHLSLREAPDFLTFHPAGYIIILFGAFKWSWGERKQPKEPGANGQEGRRTGSWGQYCVLRLENDLFLEIQSLLREGNGYPQWIAMTLWLGLGSTPQHTFPNPNPVVLLVAFIIFCHHFPTEPQNRIIRQTKVCHAWDQT